MKNIKSGFLIALTALFMYTTNVSAGELITRQEQNERDIANISENLTIILTEILNTYKGTVTANQLYEAAVIGITNILDQFSRFLSEEEFMIFSGNTGGGAVTYGLIIATDADGYVVVYSVFEDSIAERAGILKDDIIKSINNIAVQGLDLDVILEIVNLNSDVYLNLEIIRNDEVQKFSLQKGTITYTTVTVTHFNDIFYHTLDHDNDHIRHISISRMGQDTPIEFKKYVEVMQSEGVRDIILDLRGNLGGHLYTAIEISNMLIPEGNIMFIVDNDNNIYEVYTNSGNRPFEQIIVIVDANTASSAEIIAAALQDSGAIVVGSTTYGKGLIQTAIEISDGGVLVLTTHESLRGNGKPIHNIGIVPDIYITIPNPLMRIGFAPSEIFANAMRILEFIGYEIGDINDQNNYTNLQAIQDFQANNNIEISYSIDSNTISALNESLFTVHLEMDRALEMAYSLLIS